LYAFVAAAPLAAAALAAASPAAAQSTDESLWSGFYVGAVVGGAWGDTKVHSTLTAPSGAIVSAPDLGVLNGLTSHDETTAGFTGGLEGGYNYRWGSWVIGGEVDWTALDLNNNSTKTAQSTVQPAISYSLQQSMKTDWMVTLRPRLGYAYGPWLFYGTTGFAWAELKYNATLQDNRSPQNSVSASSSSTKTGWAFGLGGGYAFTPQLSAKLEWLYADFGKVGSAVTTNFATITPDDGLQTNMFRVGMDYRF
jgi:outer membrane immunogenic protein